MAETTALSAHIGAQVTGVGDLLDEAVIATCLEALKWRGVLLIRGLHLDDSQQVAFSRRIGEVVYTRQWQEGDLIAWDNTGMLHRALPYSAQSRRTLHRTTVHGTEAFT